MFFKIGVFNKNFASFTGKHLFWSLFLIKLFFYEIYEIFKNTFFTEHLRADRFCLELDMSCDIVDWIDLAKFTAFLGKVRDAFKTLSNI